MLHGHQSAPSAGGKVQRAIASTLHLKDDGFVETVWNSSRPEIRKDLEGNALENACTFIIFYRP